MTEASQLTKPRPTQQTAAGSPPYTNKLLQALAVTFQVSFFTYLKCFRYPCPLPTRAAQHDGDDVDTQLFLPKRHAMHAKHRRLG